MQRSELTDFDADHAVCTVSRWLPENVLVMEEGSTFLLCCDISGVKDLSTVWRSSKRAPLCVRHHSTYKDAVISRKSSSRLKADTMKTQKRVKALQEKAGRLVRIGCSERRLEVLDEIGSLLSM